MELSFYFSVAILVHLVESTGGACPVGMFGRKCRYTCHCIDNENCDVISGTCTDGCAAGWSGPTCQRGNIAFGRPCQQKEGDKSQNASLAVDADVNTCSSTKADVPGWWTLTLGSVKRITGFTLITDYLNDFYDWRVYVGRDDEIFSMSPCTTIQLHDNGATLQCKEPVYGRYIKIVNREGPVVICDFQILECSPFTFDKMCTKTCNCFDFTERCDRKDGVCTSGCDSGWMGSDCYTECDGHYGENCAYTCGHCKNGSSCDRNLGTCPNGCEPGYTGILCNQPCQDSFFGVSCAERCGHCYEHTPCDHVNGTCMTGCQAGWSGSNCKQRCGPGSFGENCVHSCGHCLYQDTCDPVGGVCANGCEPGWEGLFCTQECLPGFYGYGCKQSCEHCFQGLCHKVSGQCLHGCRQGRMGVNCTKECAFDIYGINCSSKCDRCNDGKGRLCDVTSGECTYGCLPGYNGTNCLTACPDGLYGVNCVAKCGACKPSTTCDKTTGRCLEGCAKNYFGELCTQTAAFSDDSGSQLQVFLGTTLGIVGSLMTVVTICLVLVWKREHLPKVELIEPPPEKVVRLEDQNGRLLCSEEEEEEVEDEL